MSWLNKIKQFIGMFNLTPFEEHIIKTVEQHLSSDMCAIFRDQLSQFNRVDRFLGFDERIDYGFTSFYWMKWGKSQLDFPKYFPNETEEAKLADIKIVCDDKNVISVTLWIVKGVFFQIEYRSPEDEYQPTGAYKIQSVKVYMPYRRETTVPVIEKISSGKAQETKEQEQKRTLEQVP